MGQTPAAVCRSKSHAPCSAVLRCFWHRMPVACSFASCTLSVGRRVRVVEACHATAPGLAASSPPLLDAARPRVTIVNRAHRAGRSIVTAPEALERIRPSEAYSSTQLVYMEQKTLREQVR